MLGRGFRLGLACVVALAFCVLDISGRAHGKPRLAPSCQSNATSGTFNVATVPGGSFSLCSYSLAGSWIVFSGSAANSGAGVSVQAPKGGGRCAGSAGIVISYSDAAGTTYAAISSDGKHPEILGSCDITVTRATDKDFSGTVNA